MEGGGEDDDRLGLRAHLGGEVAQEADRAVVPHVGMEVFEEEDGVVRGFVDLGEGFEFGARERRAAGLADGRPHPLGEGPGVEGAVEALADGAQGVLNAPLLPGDDVQDGILGAEKHLDLAGGGHWIGG